MEAGRNVVLDFCADAVGYSNDGFDPPPIGSCAFHAATCFSARHCWRWKVCCVRQGGVEKSWDQVDCILVGKVVFRTLSLCRSIHLLQTELQQSWVAIAFAVGYIVSKTCLCQLLAEVTLALAKNREGLGRWIVRKFPRSTSSTTHRSVYWSITISIIVTSRPRVIYLVSLYFMIHHIESQAFGFRFGFLSTHVLSPLLESWTI